LRTAAAGSQSGQLVMPPIPLTVAMHWFQVEKPQFDAPPKRPP
jgi:hypothetical protein